MTEYDQMADQLQARMNDLLARARVIEDDLRHPLEADFSDQAIDLADDEALEGVDEVLRAEVGQIRNALLRMENGTYGTARIAGGYQS